MAIAFTEKIANHSDTSTAVAATYSTASWTPTNGRGYVLFLRGGHLFNAPKFTPSGNGLTWVEVGTAGGLNFNASSDRIQVWRCLPASGSSAGVITITVSNNSADFCTWNLWEITGMDTGGSNGANMIVQNPSNSGSGTSLSVTMSALGNSSNCYLTFWTSKQTTTSITDSNSGTNGTRIDSAISAWQSRASYKLNSNAPAASTSPTSNTWGGFALEIKILPLNLTASVTEAPATADVATRTAPANRSVTEAPATADVAVASKTFLRGTAEAPTTADVATRAAGSWARSVTSAPTTADVATRSIPAARTVTEAPATADVAMAAKTIVRSITEAPTTADVATRLSVKSRSATEAPTTADVATLLRSVLRSVSEAPTLADVATRGVTFQRSATEAPHTADVASRTITAARSVTEAPMTADVATRLATLYRYVTENPMVLVGITITARIKHRIQYHAIVFSPDANGGPGSPSMELDGDVLNLAWQQGINAPGQAVFAMYRRNKKIDAINWMQDHIKLYRETTKGTRTVFSGKLAKPMWSDIDVFAYAWDYLAFLQLSRTGYRVAYPTKLIGTEVISPEWTLAKNLTNSPFTFVTTGTFEDPLGLDGVTKIKTNAEFGMTDFNRLFAFSTLADMAMANTNYNVKFEITRESPHTFNLWKDYGANNTDYAFIGPGNVSGYDFDAGFDAIRHDIATILSDGHGGHAEVTALSADANTTTYRRLQVAMAVRTLFGLAAGAPESDQGIAALKHQLVRASRYPREFVVRPRQGEYDPFLGSNNDLGDKFRSTVQNASGGDLYDGYLRLTQVAASWAKNHGEMVQLKLRGVP